MSEREQRRVNEVLSSVLSGAPSVAERRDHRFRIAGDGAEAMKVVLAQLAGDER